MLFGPGPEKGDKVGKLGKGYAWIKDEYDLPREAVKAEQHHQMEMLKG